MKLITIDSVLYLVKKSDFLELQAHVNSLCGSYTVSAMYEFQKAMDKVKDNCYFRFDIENLTRHNFFYGNKIYRSDLPTTHNEYDSIPF